MAPDPTSNIQRSVYAHSLICISCGTCEIDYCSFFVISFNHRVCISAGGYTLPEDTCHSIQCSTMNINNNGTILADTSPRLTRCHSIGPIRGTGSDRMVGAPRIILRENTNVTYVQSNNCELWYRNYDSNIQIKDSHISLQDIFDESHTDLMASISTCSAQNCKTCDILIARNSFNSNLTGRSFCTKTL